MAEQTPTPTPGAAENQPPAQNQPPPPTSGAPAQPTSSQEIVARDNGRVRELETKNSELEKSLQEMRSQVSDLQAQFGKLGSIPGATLGKSLLDEVNEALGL